MTPLEASTVCLVHGDGDWLDRSPRRVVGVDTFAPEPVSFSSTAKFGSHSIDVFTANYGGRKWVGGGLYFAGARIEIECLVYLRAIRTSSQGQRHFAGVSGTTLGTDTFFGLSHTDAGRPRFFFRNRNTNSVTNLDGPDSLPTGGWVHLKGVVDEAGARTLCVEGVPVAASSTVVPQVSGNGDFVLGSFGNSGSYPADTLIQEARYVAGYPITTGSFTPETSAYPDCPAVSEGRLLPSPQARQSALFDAVHPKRFSPPMSLRDVYYGGRGLISGMVKLKGNPLNLPLRRKVWLMRDRDAVVIRETWSDATTAAYAFPYIDETQRYSTIAFDHTHDKRAVIADNQIPDLMP